MAQAVERTPGVVGLHGGRFGEVATYRPGGRIAGVRLGETAQVHVVVEYGTRVPDVAAAVRDAVAPLVDTPVDVTVEDVAAPGATSTRPDAEPPSPTDHPSGRTS
ncbi:Asp23/Gls24 family envelope stress response protein [Knoellia koreensis]|uniref:Asp23/Gls24 family envelope stress response protein n=1 Tax=Knoellia koreensis TaxID=2730921 RepID=UPI003211E1CF